jgi:ferredoxin
MVSMTWKLAVDQTACIGSGMCAALAPDLFRLDGEYAEPVHAEVSPDDLALDAADQCPTMAITVREGEVEIGPRP